MRDLTIILRRFKSYFVDYIWYFVIAIFGMIMASFGTAFSAYLVKPVLDKIFVEKNEDLLYLLPYAIIFIYFIKSLGLFLQAYFTAFIGQDVVKRFRNRLLKNLLSLDMQFFNDFRVGELISRTMNDVERIRNVVATMVPQLIRDTLTCIGLLAVVIYQSPKLAFFALIFFPLVIYPLSRLAKKMKNISKNSQEKLSDLSSNLNEIFTNIEIVKASNAQEFEYKKFKDQNEYFAKLAMKGTKTSEFVSPMMETIGAFGIAVVIIVGGKEVIDEQMSVGSFFSFLTALFMIYTPLKNISKIYNSMQDAIVASQRTFELIDKTPSIVSGEKEFPQNVNFIIFQDVFLKYANKTALNGINFCVNKGEILALVGNSGGGKTSIVNLLMRFYDATNGNILINDCDLRELNIKSLRQNIGLVSQRIFIFRDTIAKNIAYGDEIDEKKVIAALKMANAYDFVKELDGGINFVLNEFGTNLSGGQRQRIAIARALYKNPQIIIFDEATSALDNKSEKEITEAIEKLRKDKILIIIAHRLTTIKNADKIAVINNGKVVGIGTDESLLKNCPIYQRLNFELNGVKNI